jgi:hypothetical protein
MTTLIQNHSRYWTKLSASYGELNIIYKSIVTYQDSPVTQQLNGASLLYSLVSATMKTNASQQWKQNGNNEADVTQQWNGSSNYYGYASEIEEILFKWRRSWGLERKEIARTHCVRSVISICVRELVEAVRVLEF